MHNGSHITKLNVLLDMSTAGHTKSLGTHRRQDRYF